MQLSKRKFNEFIRAKGPSTALFDREIEPLFQEFKEFSKDPWGKVPRGLKYKIFKKWLQKAGYVLASKQNKK